LLGPKALFSEMVEQQVDFLIANVYLGRRQKMNIFYIIGVVVVIIVVAGYLGVHM
jgi:hypothetical protein